MRINKSTIAISGIVTILAAVAAYLTQDNVVIYTLCSFLAMAALTVCATRWIHYSFWKERAEEKVVMRAELLKKHYQPSRDLITQAQ